MKVRGKDMARSNLELASAMGKRMAQQRKACGLTQEAVADLAGITHQQYNKAENGKTCLSSDTLLRVSTALQTSADYLLSGRKLPEKYITTIDLLDKMTDGQIALANKMIRCIVEYDNE